MQNIFHQPSRFWVLFHISFEQTVYVDCSAVVFTGIADLPCIAHLHCRLPAQTFRCRPPLQTPGAHITYLADLLRRLALPSNDPFSALAFWVGSEPQSFLCPGLLGKVRASMFPSALVLWGPSPCGTGHIWSRGHWGPAPFGPRPIWTKSRLGPGLIGPGPVWARAHLGRRPT